MHPLFTVSGASGAFTGPGGRGLSCTVVDQEGRESDTCTVVVDDKDGIISPPIGSQMTVAMGYVETGAMPMGMFTVEEVTMDGWPRSMTIHGTGADMTKELKSGRTQDYHQKTIMQILSEVAGRHGLAPAVQGAAGAFMYQYLGQTEESDLNLLTRLGVEHDAIAKVSNGMLIFAKKGMGMSASGLAMGSAVARFPDNVKSYSCTLKSRPAHGESQGSHWQNDMAERGEEKGSGGGGGGGSAIFQIPQMFADGIKEAQAAGQAKADSLGRAEGHLSITIIGEAGVMAESILTVVGVRADVDGAWRVKSATHTINDSGYETQIEAEYPG